MLTSLRKEGDTNLISRFKSTQVMEEKCDCITDYYESDIEHRIRLGIAARVDNKSVHNNCIYESDIERRLRTS